MQRERSTKIIAVVALLIAVVGLSIGFAAYDATLNINNTTATVTGSSENFKVLLSNNNSSSGTEADVVIDDVASSVEGGATAVLEDDASMTSDTISGLSANFNKPGQSVSYTFYAHNAGAVYAYLNAITFANVADANSTKVCTPGAGTDAASVAAACEGISISVKVGTDAARSESDADINNHGLAKGTPESVVVTIDYATGSSAADGDFSVKFGNIQLLYKSVD